MNHTFKLIIIAIALMLSILLSGCGGTDNPEKLKETIVSKCDYEISDFILDKMVNNRIVMIGESKHGQYLYMKTISDILNLWITTIENEGTRNIPTKLCLVLEMDSTYSKHLNKFIHTGNYRDMLDLRLFTTTEITMGNILFYNDLRNISKRVNEYNEKRSDNSVQLEIIGPEKNWDLTNWSFKEANDYFIYQRDINIKNNIDAYVDSHPNHRILIYYGNAHLTSDKVMKSVRGVSGESYYLGHYLQSEYANDGGFYRICQANPSASHGSLDGILVGPDANYIIENRYFKHSEDFRKIVHSDGDASVIYISQPYRFKPLCTVFSENNTKFLIENLDSLKNLSFDFQQLIWGNVLNYLYIISGNELLGSIKYRDKNVLDTVIINWKGWYENSDHDNVAEIEDLSIWNRLIDNLKNSPPERVRRTEALLAIALDMEPLNQTKLSAEERAEGYRKYINDNRKIIVIDNLIPLLIIGTDQEHEKALAALKKETGQDYDNYRDLVEWRYRVRSFK